MSRYRVRLPAARLPIIALELDVGGGHVYRPAVVSESTVRRRRGERRWSSARRCSRACHETASRPRRCGFRSPRRRRRRSTWRSRTATNEPLDVRGVSPRARAAALDLFRGSGGRRRRAIRRPGRAAARSTIWKRCDGRSILQPCRKRRGAMGVPPASAARRAHRRTLVPPVGSTLDPSPFKYLRAVEGNHAGGRLIALPLDAHVARVQPRDRHSRFADVRLIDGANQQIPYLVERRNEPLSLAVSHRPASGSESDEIARLKGAGADPSTC